MVTGTSAGGKTHRNQPVTCGPGREPTPEESQTVWSFVYEFDDLVPSSVYCLTEAGAAQWKTLLGAGGGGGEEKSYSSALQHNT
ncbi:hypothetical protein RRG08_061139 [Elysia crispata]|uniref:Uncharacterized protein n=1 Tax=Elysia crispata TaxID=231223 RepID=A0AAE0XDJ3_9GAST|nr:hypothetical protein RRG08_061139 [Elysia crispata]